MTAMFTALTEAERRALGQHLRHAGERLGDEANQLAGAPASVLAAYDLPRDSYHGFYSAAIEASMLAVEVFGSGPVT